MAPVRASMLFGLALAAVFLVGCNGTTTTPIASLTPEAPSFDLTQPEPGPSAGTSPVVPIDLDEEGDIEEDSSGAIPPAAGGVAPGLELPTTPADPTPPAGGPPVTPPSPGPPVTPPSPGPPVTPPGPDTPVGPPIVVPPVDPPGPPGPGGDEELDDEGHSPELGTMTLLLLSGIGAGAARLRRRRKG